MTTTTRVSDPSNQQSRVSQSSQSYSSTKIFKYTLLAIFLLVLLYLFYNWFLREDTSKTVGLEIIDWVGPYEWAALGIAAALGLSVIGAGW